MKTNKKLKNAFIGVTVITTAVLCLSACDMNRGKEDTKEIAEDRNEETIDNRQLKKDAEFLVEAAAINLEEIQLGQLAQTRSNDSEVKEIARMMENNHSESLNELKELASKKGIAIPTELTEEGQEEYNELNEKRETDFNEEYCEKMIKGHKEAIEKFEKAAVNAEDPDIKAWATATLPKLRTHLGHANMCESKNNKKSASISK